MKWLKGDWQHLGQDGKESDQDIMGQITDDEKATGGANMTYQSAMQYMETCQQYGSVLGLCQIRELLRRLGNPQDALSVIHIAGTNGKGSVGAYLDAIFMQAGYVTGRYATPAIFSYREQFRINGAYVGEEDIAQALTEIAPVAEKMTEDGYQHATPFEIETAMAFWIFRKRQCGLVLLEVGMGGREDATNVVLKPLCSLITSISMDHMVFLGDTIEKITMEKAGIIKRGCPAIAYDYRQETDGDKILPILKTVSGQVQSDFYQADFEELSHICHTLSGVTFRYRGEAYQTAMLGENQPKNAALALEAIRVLNGEAGRAGCILKEKVTKEQCRNGILCADWQGRFSVISKAPLIIADGAHNEGAAKSLKHSVSLYLKNYQPIYIMGVFRDKQYEKIASILADPAATLYTVTPPVNRGLASSKLAEAASPYYCEVIDAGTVERGMELALSMAEKIERERGKKCAILIFGTLSTLPEVYRCVDTIDS